MSSEGFIDGTENGGKSPWFDRVREFREKFPSVSDTAKMLALFYFTTFAPQVGSSNTARVMESTKTSKEYRSIPDNKIPLCIDFITTLDLSELAGGQLDYESKKMYRDIFGSSNPTEHISLDQMQALYDIAVERNAPLVQNYIAFIADLEKEPAGVSVGDIESLLTQHKLPSGTTDYILYNQDSAGNWNMETDINVVLSRIDTVYQMLCDLVNTLEIMKFTLEFNNVQFSDGYLKTFDVVNPTATIGLVFAAFQNLPNAGSSSILKDLKKNPGNYRTVFREGNGSWNTGYFEIYTTKGNARVVYGVADETGVTYSDVNDCVIGRVLFPRVEVPSGRLDRGVTYVAAEEKPDRWAQFFASIHIGINLNVGINGRLGIGTERARWHSQNTEWRDMSGRWGVQSHGMIWDLAMQRTPQEQAAFNQIKRTYAMGIKNAKNLQKYNPMTATQIPHRKPPGNKPYRG